jgi:hypothetical protein
VVFQEEVEKMRFVATAVAVLALAASAYGSERQPKAVQMREDFGTEPLYDCYMNYYYYIPCPTSSWFWSFSGWPIGAKLGVFYTIGDASMGRAASGCPPYLDCDPCGAHVLEQFRMLDFAGYGTVYPGLFTVKFDVWCSDAHGCPVGPSLWTSGPVEFCAHGWNYVVVTPQLCLSDCYTELQGSIKCYPRFLITSTAIGSVATYPQWGCDNLSTPLGLACLMHDTGCCPALYPRPYVSHYSTIHSGYYGINFEFCPPQWFLDGADTVGNVTGFIELAWRVYLKSIYTATEQTTWGNIKSMYR